MPFSCANLGDFSCKCLHFLNTLANLNFLKMTKLKNIKKCKKMSKFNVVSSLWLMASSKKERHFGRKTFFPMQNFAMKVFIYAIVPLNITTNKLWPYGRVDAWRHVRSWRAHGLANISVFTNALGFVLKSKKKS